MTVNPERPKEFILLQEIPGRVITGILTTSEYDDENSLYTGGCVVVIDNNIIIGIPKKFSDKILISEAESDLSDYPSYNLNKIQVIKKVEPGFERILNEHWKNKTPLPEKYAHVITWHERKVKYLQNRIIRGFLFLNEEWPDSGFIELDNGFILGEIQVTQPGAGLPGYSIYESITDFEKRYGKAYSVFPDR